MPVYQFHATKQPQPSFYRLLIGIDVDRTFVLRRAAQQGAQTPCNKGAKAIWQGAEQCAGDGQFHEFPIDLVTGIAGAE